MSDTLPLPSEFHPPTALPEDGSSRPAAQLEALLPDLRRLARHLTRDPVGADDLVQDVLLRLWIRMADQEQSPILDLRPYAFAALRHRVQDRASAPALLLTDPNFEPPVAPEAPARLLTEEVLQAIANLPPQQGSLLRLRAIEGLSYSEIAERTSLSKGTVTSRLSRARAALREALEMEESEGLEELLS